MNHPTLLEHDHSELDGLLAAARAAFTAGVVEQSFQAVDIFWARLAMHIRAEHLHLFPTIIQAVEAAAQKKVSGSPTLEMARSRIAQLQEDHDYFMRELAAAVKELRALCEEQRKDEAAVLSKVQARILAVSRRLELHNEIEEAEVYQWAGLLLEPAAQVALTEKIEGELENLPPRFENK